MSAQADDDFATPRGAERYGRQRGVAPWVIQTRIAVAAVGAVLAPIVYPPDAALVVLFVLSYTARMLVTGGGLSPLFFSSSVSRRARHTARARRARHAKWSTRAAMVGGDPSRSPSTRRFAARSAFADARFVWPCVRWLAVGSSQRRHRSRYHPGLCALSRAAMGKQELCAAVLRRRSAARGSGPLRLARTRCHGRVSTAMGILLSRHSRS